MLANPITNSGTKNTCILYLMCYNTIVKGGHDMKSISRTWVSTDGEIFISTITDPTLTRAQARALCAWELLLTIGEGPLSEWKEITSEG